MSNYVFFAAAIFIIDALLRLFGIDLSHRFIDDSHHTTVDYFHQLYIGLFFFALGLLIQHAEETDDRVNEEAEKKKVNKKSDKDNT